MTRTGGAPDDTGAVAVLVAVLMSTVLLVAGALTVDLGSVWAARAGLQGAADAAALAAAAVLPDDPRQEPDTAAVVAEAVRVLCADGNRKPGWGDNASACRANDTWATDADPANGDVLVERSPADAYPGIPSTEPELLPWIVAVRTPPVHVTFGLARAAGLDGTDVRAAAGGRRGLPYPGDSAMARHDGPLWAFSPYSPYYLTVADLRAAHGTTGAICLRTLPRNGTGAWTPPGGDAGFEFGAWVKGSDGVVVGDTDRDGLPDLPDANAHSFEVTGTFFGSTPPATVTAADVTVYVGAEDPAHVAKTDDVQPDGAGWRVKFTTPDLRLDTPFGQVPVWWVLRDPASGAVVGTSQQTPATLLEYPTTVASGDCDLLAAGRGLVDADTLSGGQTLRDAVARGMDTRLAPFGTTPRAQPLPPADTACDDAAVTGEAVPADLASIGPWANCVPLAAPAQVRVEDLTAAWLGTDPDPDRQGRLRTLCSPQVGSVNYPTGAVGGFDQTDLFSFGSGLLRPGADSFGLRFRVRQARAADPARARSITDAVFDCPRLLLVPVIDATPPADPSVRHAVVGFTYFWVSDVRTRSTFGRPTRGLMVTRTGDVVGIRGWAVDPGYVQGGDWVAHNEAPDVALPYSVPRRSVLVRFPCDGSPDSACPP